MSRQPEPHAGMVNVVVAYAAEARPLVQHFGLANVQSGGGFRLYASPPAAGAGMRLLVTGRGKVAAAAGAAYLFAHGGSVTDDAWLNAGIGGHRELPLGSVRIAHRVMDRTTGSRWYPQPVFRLACGSIDVTTVDAPEQEYPDDAIYDMEASAFYETCLRFATAELVHVVKCVSDNRHQPLHDVTPQLAEQLVAGALPVIESAVAAMIELAATQRRLHADAPEFTAFLERWHFTVTQTAELRDVLRRWRLIHHDRPALHAVAGAPTSRAVLQTLARALEALPTQLGATPPEVRA